MKNNKTFLSPAYIIISLFIIAMMSSCSKSKVQKELEGTWKRIETSNVTDSSGMNEYWTFDNNNIIITKSQSGDTAATKIDQGTYVIKIKLDHKELAVKGFGEEIQTEGFDYRQRFYNTIWTIDLLDENVFSMFGDKEDNFIYYEFEKAE